MTVAICDSSAFFMDRFIEETSKFDSTIDVVTFRKYGELVDSGKLGVFDCVFIATEINNQSGVDIALEIHVKNPEVEIVFVTENCEKYSQRIFDYADRFRPFALLCKPVSRMLLHHVYEMLKRVSERRKSKDIIIRLEDKDCISINTSDIMYIQHNNRISYIYTYDGECLTSRHSISWFEERLPDCFLHCAKSCLVNIMKVKSVNGLEIKLSNDSSIWCSRQYRKSFADSFEECHN